MAADSSLQEQLKNAFAGSMTMQTAEAILNLRSSPEVQAYASTLAERSREGLLTPEEQQAYESYADMVGTVSLLQAQARRALKGTGQH